jgi:hypothetical protein
VAITAQADSYRNNPRSGPLAALRKPSKLEVENHVTGIYFPASSQLLAGGRAGLWRLCKHSGLQPFPEFFDAPRTFVRIAVLARRHLVRATATAPATRSRMYVVGSQDKSLFDFGVSFLRIVQLRSAVPTSTAALRPEVFPPEFRRSKAKSHSSQTVVESLLWAECPTPAVLL